MSLSQSHSAMLKRYLKEDIIMSEMAKKSYLWDNVNKEYDWAGGILEIPVLKNGFNTVQMGSLAAISDITEAEGGVGTLTAHKELTLSAIFREADLARHTDREKSYLTDIPKMIDGLSTRASEQINSGILRGGAVITKAAANGTAALGIQVENPEFFEPKMKVAVVDNDTAEVVGYVRTVDLNTGIITVFNARTAGAVVDLSLYTTAQNARVRIVGGSTESFLDLRTACLPAAISGGSDTLYGLTKLDYNPLQAYRKDGSGFTAATILDDLFADFWNMKRLGRGDQDEMLVGYGIFKNAAKKLETARQYQVTNKKAGYGFDQIELIGGGGSIKLTALREMPNDSAVYVNLKKGIKFKGLALKKQMYGDAGLEYFVDRQTTGISYVTDMVLRGDFVYEPQQLGFVYGIPAAASV